MSKPSKEVIARSQKKIYSRYNITFRKDSDADIIQLIEDNRAAGISPTATVRELYKAYMAAQDAGVYFG